MDNKVYFDILNGLKEYNKSLSENYGNAIYSLPPKLDKDQNLKFPITRFSQTRNIANSKYNTCYERVSSLGFSLDIFAKDKGTKKLRNEIALDLAEKLNAFLTNICGLLQTSYNEFDLEAQGSIYRITMTYSGNLHENRRRFI
jgi:hypothetical protein